MEDLAALVAANEDAAAAIAAAYEVLLGGVPNVAGFTFLIENALATNFGSDDPSITFNQENIFINVANALVQGNPDAAAGFAALTAGAASLSDKVAAIYNALIAPADHTAEGLAYLTRPEALAFYAAVAAERGVAGPDGAAIVALASILNIAVQSDLTGIGDSVNDLLAAIADGSAQLPASGDTFTPIEDADGTNFDGDDAGVLTLTTGADNLTGSSSGDRFEAPTVQTALLPNQTLNSGDRIDGGGGRDTLWAQLSDFIVQPQSLTSIEHLSLENSPLALGLALGPRIVDAIHADSIDEVSFRAPNANIITGLGVTNVSTVVKTVNINDSGSAAAMNPGGDHLISFIGTALDGDADEVTVNLNNVYATSLELQGAYELATINSVGPVENVFSLIIDTLEELTIIGNQDLDLAWLEIDPLVLVDASTFTGDLIAGFFNYEDAGLDGINDAIEVIGGLGSDDLYFDGPLNSDVTVSTGESDDFVTFYAIAGQSSFDEDDSVDGGEGIDELWLDVRFDNAANEVDLLVDGVGDNINNIERIVHFADGTVWDDIHVDWTRSGSATELELSANYNDQDVVVTGLTNEDTVIYSGDDVWNLELSSLNGGGSLSNVINLTIETTLPGSRVDIHDDLQTDVDTELLNLHVSGLGYVEIDEADVLESNVVITGTADLSLGVDDAYDLDNGTIDASAFTGDLTVALGLGHQSLSGGSGDDYIIIDYFNFTNADNTDRIFLASGGADTVEYHGVVSLNGGEALNSNANPHINGFSIADDVIALDRADLGLENLGGAAFNVNDPAVIAEIAQGLAFVLPNAVTLLKFTTAFTGAAGTSVDAAFDFVIGGGSVTAVTPDASNDDLLAMYYDATNSQAVIVRIFDNAAAQDVFTSADRVDLITTIGMTAADYAGFSASNIDFV